MSNTKCAIAALPIPVCSSALVYILSGISGFVIGTPIMAIIYAAIYISNRKLELRKATKNEQRELMRALTTLYTYLHDYKKPICIGLKAAINATDKESTVHNLLYKIHLRQMARQDFAEATIAECKAQNPTNFVTISLTRIANEYAETSNLSTALKNEYDCLCRGLVAKESALQGSVQKYSTVAMVSSTILPTFAIFALIGYSIVNNQATNILVFSLLLGLVLPGAYDIIRAHIAGVYE